MNYKIRVTKRDMFKVLDVVSDYRKARKGIVYVDKSFYDALLPMSKVKVNQAINALQSEDVIEAFSLDGSSEHLCLRLTSHAFAYRMHRRETEFHFWVPTIISILAIIISSISAAPTIMNLLRELLKLLQ